MSLTFNVWWSTVLHPEISCLAGWMLDMTTASLSCKIRQSAGGMPCVGDSSHGDVCLVAADGSRRILIYMPGQLQFYSSTFGRDCGSCDLAGLEGRGI